MSTTKTRVTVDTSEEYFEGYLVSLDEDSETLVMRTDEGELIRVNLNILTLDYAPDNSINIY